MVGINTNTGALMAARAAKLVQRNVDDASLRLSTGRRVNASADDAAGLAVANKMVNQIRGMKTAFKNTSDGISLLQTAIAGMQNSLDIVQRLRELALQSHNGVYVNGDRDNLQMEADELVGELNRIATHTKFNDINLLDGTYSKDMRVGNTNPEIVNVTIDGMGINKHIDGESFATGASTQILSPQEFAYGSSDFSIPATSFASGEMEPRYLNSAIATGNSSFNLLVNSQANVLSSNPSYLSEDIATGSSQYNLAAQSTANGTSTAVYQPFTNAEIVSGSSLSSTSTFTTVGFQNGDFSEGTATMSGNVASIPGWDIHFEQPELDGDPYLIGGFQAPLDNDIPYRYNESQSSDFLNNSQITNPNLNNLVRDGALYLEQGGYRHDSFTVVRGPYVISQESVALEIGDQVSFKWFGLAGGDAYDVYGYLLNTADGSVVELLNETATTSYSSTQDLGMGDNGWVSASVNINSAGDYKFVFIAGSYDRTGGLYLGNGLAIKDVDVIQANPPSITDATARVTIQAVESDEIRISSSLLTSATTSVLSDPGGTFSIVAEGGDDTKFTIDPNTGNITSNQSLRFNTQQNYRFKVLYNGPNGTTHTETVILNLTPQDEAYSSVTALESGSLIIDQNQFTTFSNFVGFENSRNTGNLITYSLASYSDNDGNPSNDGDPNDYLEFTIDPSTGAITSNGALDYTVQNRYQFNAIATTGDGRTFTNHIILDLQDTTNSTATLSVEETDRIKINISELTSSSDFAARYAGGSFSISDSGLDNIFFDVVGSEIIANNTFRIPNKNSYTFDLVYTNGGDQHTERVTVNLTEFLQSDSNMTALESSRVELSIDDLSHITDFASDDGYAGTFFVRRYDNEDGNPLNDGDANDYMAFAIDADTRTVYSRNALDFSVDDTYHFNLVYRASNGVEFTDRVILQLEDTLISSASLEVEEANQMVINISDLTASNTYASRNPGGTFSIGAGTPLFNVVGSQIIATKEFRKEEQASYDFELIYTHGGVQHLENVHVDLTRFMQSEGEFTALESDRVIIRRDGFTYLDDFANDNPDGRYLLSGADAGLFGVNESASIAKAI